MGILFFNHSLCSRGFVMVRYRLGGGDLRGYLLLLLIFCIMCNGLLLVGIGRLGIGIGRVFGVGGFIGFFGFLVIRLSNLGLCSIACSA